MLVLRKQKQSRRDMKAALAYSKEFTQSLIMVPPPLPCLTGKLLCLTATKFITFSFVVKLETPALNQKKA